MLGSESRRDSGDEPKAVADDAEHTFRLHRNLLRRLKRRHRAVRAADHRHRALRLGTHPAAAAQAAGAAEVGEPAARGQTPDALRAAKLGHRRGARSHAS